MKGRKKVMNVQEEKLRASSERLNELEITTHESGKPYVFISYKSDNWKEALEEVVYTLQKRYGLRIYYDRDFESNNDKWTKIMEQNITSTNCMAVLIFLTKEYISLLTFSKLSSNSKANR